MNHWVAMSSFYFLKDAYQASLLAQENNFSGIELWADVPFLFVDGVKPRMLKKIGKIKDLKFSLHTPIYGINISSVNPGILTESIRQVKKALAWTDYLEIERLILHPGDSPSPLKSVRDISTSILYESIDDLLSSPGSDKTELLMENIALSPKDTLAEPDEFVDFLKTSGLNCCLDVGHANIRWGHGPDLASLKPYIKQIHISDNDGFEDAHLPAGDGVIDWSLLGGLIEKDIPLVHEVRDLNDVPAGILRSRDYIEKCFT